MSISVHLDCYCNVVVLVILKYNHVQCEWPHVKKLFLSCKIQYLPWNPHRPSFTLTESVGTKYLTYDTYEFCSKKINKMRYKKLKRTNISQLL